jgi:hypothetical protein
MDPGLVIALSVIGGSISGFCIITGVTVYLQRVFLIRKRQRARLRNIGNIGNYPDATIIQKKTYHLPTYSNEQSIVSYEFARPQKTRA